MTARRRTPAEKAADEALVRAEKEAALAEAERLGLAALRDLNRAVRTRTRADTAAERAEQAVQAEITPARLGGSTWPRIGEVLGLTKPGVAYNLFHRYDESPAGHRSVRDVDQAVLKPLEKAVKARTHAREAAAAAEDEVTRAVIAARRVPVHPVTWPRIAEALGIASKDNAIVKYAPLVASATLRERRKLT